eukprot:Clim_evm64s33 gene=Clim_evmTU64s33
MTANGGTSGATNGEEILPGLLGSFHNTPLMEIPSLSEYFGARIAGKAEFLSPGGSIKDRPALSMVLGAAKDGKLKPGDTVVEGTGGNTGLGLALVANALGYKCVVVQNEDISIDKRNTVLAFGAEVILTKACAFSDPGHYWQTAKRYAEEHEGAVFVNQFENLYNSQAHYEHTGPEIWRQTNGKVDGFCCAAGTGGTIAGVSRALKEKSNGEVACYLIDAPKSSLFAYVSDPKHEDMTESEGFTAGLEGVGIGRITANFKTAKVDGAFQGDGLQAIKMAWYLLRKEGIFVGPSAAMNVIGACRLAEKLKKEGKAEVPLVTTVLCDGGNRYANSVFDDEWLKEKGLLDQVKNCTLDEIFNNHSN